VPNGSGGKGLLGPGNKVRKLKEMQSVLSMVVDYCLFFYMLFTLRPGFPSLPQDYEFMFAGV
jgi:hypothetical protein